MSWKTVVAAAVLIAAPALAKAAHAEDWASSAAVDISTAHDLIRDNHPGPVDAENPRFNVWLEEGRVKALEKARVARSRADYWRTLSFYINGFQDGHLTARRNGIGEQAWPGFLTRTDAAGVTRVTVSTIPSVPRGSRILTCDNQSAEQLLADRVHPYRTNAGIPHERLLTASYLFVRDADDQATRLQMCTISVGGAKRTAPLDWKPIDAETLRVRVREAQERVEPLLGVRRVDGVWFVSLPSFNWFGDRAAQMKAMVEEVTRRAPILNAAPRVVIDVRGNPGGNSQWAYGVAASLWGDAAVTAVTDSFDQTVAWRASAQNARLTHGSAARSAGAGLLADAQARDDVARNMDAAQARGDPLFTQPAAPTSLGLPPRYRSPFRGKIFLLTDMRCASACLDFVDIVTRMPGVTVVGQPTSADTLYIDNVEAPLPSGNARLSYSLKVYRHRSRGSNQWYVPKHAWTGGPMTDAAVARWVRSL